MSTERMHIEPGKVVCTDCRNVTLPSVPLEPDDLEPGGWLTCDGCRVRMYSNELDPGQPARVVHISDGVPGAVYVGRQNNRKKLAQSTFANPFKVGRDGTLQEVLDKYSLHLHDQFAADGRFMLTELRALAHKPLACFCRHDGEERRPENACHADVLCDLIRELGLEGERQA